MRKHVPPPRPAQDQRPRREPCRHCKKRRASLRRRGLCWKCHADPKVRACYGFVRHAGKGGGGYGSGGAVNPRGRLPAEPTEALPGTPEKVEVMRARAARGESVFYPGRDAAAP